MQTNRYLAVIPARAGSQRLPGKNLLKLGGRTLIQIALETALEVPGFDDIVVSSDSDVILDSAREVGSTDATYHRRAEWLAGPHSSIVDTLYELTVNRPTITHTVLLNPTCPFREGTTIARSMSVVNRTDYDSTVTCYKSTAPAFRWTHTEQGFTPPPGNRSRTQDIVPALIECGGVYITPVASIVRGTLYGKRSYPIVVCKEEAIDIDEEQDYFIAWCLAEQYEKAEVQSSEYPLHGWPR